MDRPAIRVALGAVILAGAVAAACSAESVPSRMSPEELAARIEAGDAPTVLDVRTPEEFAAGHLPGAINIPHDELAGRLDELDFARDSEVVVHCERGGRASAAEAVLVEAGFSDVRDLDGHMRAWREGGYPIE
jgi:phage shock protein E